MDIYYVDLPSIVALATGTNDDILSSDSMPQVTKSQKTSLQSNSFACVAAVLRFYHDCFKKSPGNDGVPEKQILNYLQAFSLREADVLVLLETLVKFVVSDPQEQSHLDDEEEPTHSMIDAEHGLLCGCIRDVHFFSCCIFR